MEVITLITKWKEGENISLLDKLRLKMTSLVTWLQENSNDS